MRRRFDRLSGWRGGHIRDLVDCHPQAAFRRRVRVPARYYCPRCRKPVRPRVPGVQAKTRLTLNVLTRAASEHYMDGIPMGIVARRLGVPKGTLFDERHRLAALLAVAVDGLATHRTVLVGHTYGSSDEGVARLKTLRLKVLAIPAIYGSGGRPPTLRLGVQDRGLRARIRYWLPGYGATASHSGAAD